MVSLEGTHLGHNLPDSKGNRYCINLVSVAGNPINWVNLTFYIILFLLLIYINIYTN